MGISLFLTSRIRVDRLYGSESDHRNRVATSATTHLGLKSVRRLLDAGRQTRSSLRPKPATFGSMRSRRLGLQESDNRNACYQDRGAGQSRDPAHCLIPRPAGAEGRNYCRRHLRKILSGEAGRGVGGPAIACFLGPEEMERIASTGGHSRRFHKLVPHAGLIGRSWAYGCGQLLEYANRRLADCVVAFYCPLGSGV